MEHPKKNSNERFGRHHSQIFSRLLGRWKRPHSRSDQEDFDLPSFSGFNINSPIPKIDSFEDIEPLKEPESGIKIYDEPYKNEPEMNRDILKVQHKRIRKRSFSYKGLKKMAAQAMLVFFQSQSKDQGNVAYPALMTFFWVYNTVTVHGRGGVLTWPCVVWKEEDVPRTDSESKVGPRISVTTLTAADDLAVHSSTTFTMPEKSHLEVTESPTTPPHNVGFSVENNLAANIDQRYGGQYLTAEQLPEFCDQLAHLVEMVRNIQSYATLTGEYPSALEKRLGREAREVVALAAEVRNARESVERARAQRRAVRVQRREVAKHLSALREEEVRELESVIRSNDRKLFKSWETLRDSIDRQAYDPLLAEVKGKQNALECLSRLIENRCAALQLLAVNATLAPRSTLSPLVSGLDKHPRNRYFPNRRPCKRKRKDRDIPPHSVPVSTEGSVHSNAESNSIPRPPDFFTITTAAHQRSINSVTSNQSPRGSIDMNPMTVPYELVSQSGIPANMLPSMGSNSNHNLTLNLTGLNPIVPFRFGTLGTQPEIRVTTSDGDQAVGDIVFVRIEDQ